MSDSCEVETVPEALGGERIDRIISIVTGRSRSWVAEQVSAGKVRSNGLVVTTRSAKSRAGDVLEFPGPDEVKPPPQADASVQFFVAYEDDHLVVVNKPAGLVVHPGAGNPTGTLVNGLLARYPQIAGVGQTDRPGIVHRLDKGTSGLLVVALDELAYDGLVKQMSEHSPSRRYRALVLGRVEAEQGIIDAPIGRSNRDPSRMTVLASGRQARTRYSVENRFDLPVPASEVICDLDTGRTHQIRVHLRSIGHPVVGDSMYGGSGGTRRFENLDRPFLHAWQLSFRHPVTGVAVDASAEIPADLVEALASFS
ncbi:MAG: RluA family pseudouridine synthase [Acidimicrobiales bacterium]